MQHRLSGPGQWSSKGGLEETGANYIGLDMSGRHDIALEGDAGLELVLLGQAGDRIDVIPLGRAGTVDTSGFDHAALMVFNRTLPDRPGTCTSTGYALDVTAGTGTMPAAAYSFSARHFEMPE